MAACAAFSADAAPRPGEDLFRTLARLEDTVASYGHSDAQEFKILEEKVETMSGHHVETSADRTARRCLHALNPAGEAKLLHKDIEALIEQAWQLRQSVRRRLRLKTNALASLIVGSARANDERRQLEGAWERAVIVLRKLSMRQRALENILLSNGWAVTNGQEVSYDLESETDFTRVDHYERRS